jgi:hypothetical protein
MEQLFCLQAPTPPQQDKGKEKGDILDHLWILLVISYHLELLLVMSYYFDPNRGQTQISKILYNLGYGLCAFMSLCLVP